jgi:Excreted virulence factor EspC, type VII ESX diderm
MSDPGKLSVTPSDVMYSADYLESIGHRAVAERRALSTALSGNATAWQDDAKPGFSGFVGVVQRQAERMAAEVADVSGKLRDAAHAYVANEQHSVESLRYQPSDM